ncbi:putative endosomal integral membrane protein [Saitoella complicata NRRL Y-17804]|uniref:Transmembrane 9 superfamily member n=1 Tax=Saitoella complicata (strain BCRC 22490 / CBS 7301 / JCM 7358 / NBRC 10748 / NRRL Y-17804) TaxID=698492 RepID=A0A0E9NFG7_SAICN|nr:putative endosomal integral membrane protein [Saitoella complicata NRRL Y-17804]ODQ52006.1 putative endosomal integral membrane protein [Saitoella complicata NRRL Y-17804]GAO48607.1 hypothetical protein G7K_2778-t1 [Saitoella complicata NRRL Y-17804]
MRSGSVVGLLALAGVANAFYIPGTHPTNYDVGQEVPVTVNVLTPDTEGNSQTLKSLISYDYYHPSFHFCQPQGGPKRVSESLGSIIFGDRIQTSPFDVSMQTDTECYHLCTSTIPASDAKFVNDRIREDYKYNILVDGLPAARVKYDTLTETEYYSNGFELGEVIGADENGDGGVPHLNNHYEIIVEYHQIQDKYRVVGVIIQPESRAHRADPCAKTGEAVTPMILSEETDNQVDYTYSVRWQHSDTVWATRWDKYLHTSAPQIHWFSLINSAVIVAMLTALTAGTVIRALRHDFARYNALDFDSEDAMVQEDSGWKLIHGDVFRPPRRRMTLSVLLGSGAQLFFMTGATILFCALGFLSPQQRGGVGTFMVIVWTLCSFVSGYVSARTYRTLGGEAWKQNLVLTPLLVPGVVFGTFFLLNLFLVGAGSSGAVPFGTMVLIVALWFLISVPLSVAGSLLGFRQPPIAAPIKTNQIPRQIPEQVTYLKPIPSMMLAGILPFGAIFVELYFIMNSIWHHQAYYMFGFLFLCYGMMIVTCAAVTVLMSYFQLCSENYHWWWRSFFTAGATAFYIFINSLIYWATRLSFGGHNVTSSVLYLGYSLMISFLAFVLTGTIGFFSTYAFVRKIYGAIKVD